MWNPSLYRNYAGERARPFLDLTARIGAESPGHVVDLGCGPGEMTAALARRWPGADVLGVDNSAEMVTAAGRTLAEQEPGLRLRFATGDVRTVHVLSGEDPVLRWYRGTGLRPVLAALDAESRQRFLAEYGRSLRSAYPARSYGTPLRFRRVFAVARRR
ncbi:MAG: methyltransferase domain-containing protein [Streptosporangiaceae bacterium]